jgi:hypothetical protein
MKKLPNVSAQPTNTWQTMTVVLVVLVSCALKMAFVFVRGMKCWMALLIPVFVCLVSSGIRMEVVCVQKMRGLNIIGEYLVC